MHPSLEPYVDPPSLLNMRFILAGVLTGLTAIAITFAVLCYVDHRRHVEREHVVAEAQAKGRVRALVKDLAFNAWPAWVASNPDRRCPDHLAELERYLSEGPLTDAWGTSLVYQCDGVRFDVTSAGPDGEPGSADDIRSDR